MIKHDQFSALTQILDMDKIDRMSSSELAHLLSRMGADSRQSKAVEFVPKFNSILKADSRQSKAVEFVPKFNSILKFV